MDKPDLAIKTYRMHGVFFYATEVNRPARCLLSLASDFRTHGANLYKLCTNEAIQKATGMTKGQLLRAKKELRNAGLLDREGNPGDYSEIITRWEKVMNCSWGIAI